jgi:hypothetical protein
MYRAGQGRASGADRNAHCIWYIDCIIKAGGRVADRWDRKAAHATKASMMGREKCSGTCTRAARASRMPLLHRAFSSSQRAQSTALP